MGEKMGPNTLAAFHAGADFMAAKLEAEDESSDDEDVEALRRARSPKQRFAPQPTVEAGVAGLLRTECERIFGEPDSDAEEREDTASASEPSEGPKPKRQRGDEGFVVYEGFRSFGRANPTHVPMDAPNVGGL